MTMRRAVRGTDGSCAIHETVRGSLGRMIGLTAATLPPLAILFLIGLAAGDLGGQPVVAGFLLVTTVSLIGLLVLLAFLLLRTARRAVTHALVIRASPEGISVGPGAQGATGFVPWSDVVAVRSYTTSWRDTVGEDPKMLYADHFQVERRDGSAGRCDRDGSRVAWGDLETAIEQFAPNLRVQHEGVLDEGSDPFYDR